MTRNERKGATYGPKATEQEEFIGQKLLDVLETQTQMVSSDLPTNTVPERVSLKAALPRPPKTRKQKQNQKLDRPRTLSLRPVQQPQSHAPDEALPQRLGFAWSRSGLWVPTSSSVLAVPDPWSLDDTSDDTTGHPSTQQRSGYQWNGQSALHPSQINAPSSGHDATYNEQWLLPANQLQGVNLCGSRHSSANINAVSARRYSTLSTVSLEANLKAMNPEYQPPHQPSADSAEQKRFPEQLVRLKTRTNHSRSGSRTRTLPTPPPKPTGAYLQQARLTEPLRLPQPQPILIVIDLNGTLIHRPNRKIPSKFVGRPFLYPFLEYLLNTFAVMVWSSARPENVELVCRQLFTDAQRSRLAGMWGRDKLGLTSAQYEEKVQVYKRLEQVWDDPHVAKYHPNFDQGGRWQQHNTVLIDDSVTKAEAQPFNLVKITEFLGSQTQTHSDVLRQVAGYLEEVKHQQDVSAYIRRIPFRIGGRWDRPWEDGVSRWSR